MNSPFAIDRDINHLHKAMIPRVRSFILNCNKRRMRVFLLETKRSILRQLWLYGKGRLLPKSMVEKYVGAFDQFYAGDPSAKIVTYTMESKHLSGLAIDVCFMDSKGNLRWDGDWDALWDIAEYCGLKSLYRDTGFDKPHLEFNPLSPNPHI